MNQKIDGKVDVYFEDLPCPHCSLPINTLHQRPRQKNLTPLNDPGVLVTNIIGFKHKKSIEYALSFAFFNSRLPIMIKRILVPIDFSGGSAAALRYAEAFATAVGARAVKAIHVFTPQTASGDAVVMPPMGELMDQRDAAMAEFLSGIPIPEGVERTSELLLGFAADKIIEESENFDFIIMGATGETDLLEEVFGSVSSAVASKAECPVLLVPGKAEFCPYDHILYASNSLSLSRRAVLEFMDFNELFNARVHFVHVNDEEGAHEGRRESLFAPLFNNPEPEFAFEIKEVTADTVQDGLVEYLRAHKVELAVMVTKQRGFWSKLFHHSEVRQMVLHPETPMLILHLED